MPIKGYCTPLKSSKLYIFTKPSARAGYDSRSIFKQVSIQSFSSPRLVASPRLKEPSQPYYLSIAGGRIIGSIPFPRVFVLCEMQSASSRNWTRVVASISYDDHHCTMSTSFFFYFFKPYHQMLDTFLWDLTSLPRIQSAYPIPWQHGKNNVGVITAMPLRFNLFKIVNYSTLYPNNRKIIKANEIGSTWTYCYLLSFFSVRNKEA